MKLYYRQQPSPLLYCIDILPARNSRLTQRETNHYIARRQLVAQACQPAPTLLEARPNNQLQTFLHSISDLLFVVNLQSYKCYINFLQNFFVQCELQTVKYSFITYVWSKVDVFFCYSVYVESTQLKISQSIGIQPARSPGQHHCALQYCYHSPQSGLRLFFLSLTLACTNIQRPASTDQRFVG